MRKRLLHGLIPATFTPLGPDGSLRLERIPAIVDHLTADGASGVYALGSTGEGVSLTSEERMEVAEAYVRAVAGRIPVVIQVGHNSLAEAQRLAEHAQRVGADAVSATPPNYFKPDSVETLVLCVEEIASAAQELPFYYYHIPKLTGVDLNMPEFLEAASERVPSLAGIKYSDRDLDELQQCAQFDEARFEVLFGVDEMLHGGLRAGACGAVGTTYNFAAPLYRRIIHHHQAGDDDSAAFWQERAVLMVETIFRECGWPGFKAMMALTGVDCGGQRLPLRKAAPEDVEAMRRALEEIGFFEWGRTSEAAAGS